MISEQAAPRFDELYDRLIVGGVQSRISSEKHNNAGFSNPELAFLLSVASRLSFESGTSPTGAERRTKAYEIATRILDHAGADRAGVDDAARLILARLGNFPAHQLLDSIRPVSRNGLPPYLALEAAAREIENTIHIREDVPVTLTDFQVRLLGSLHRSPAVSVSAPTSAGKSYALSLDVVRRFGEGRPVNVVYLVPTRALIRQVMYETISKLNDHGFGDVPVWCVPQWLPVAEAPKGAVYVLTQERLYSLLYAASGDARAVVDILIVDEAHEIGDGGRGLVLETVIDRTLRQNPRAAVFFSSPLRSNPNYLLSLFGRENGEFFVEHSSPVSQTLIAVRRVERKQKLAKLEVQVGSKFLPVADIELPFDFGLPRLAVLLTRPDECSIVYANEPAVAEKLAEAIAAEIPGIAKLDDDVEDLIRFIRQHVHRKYRLAACLERGVAFHYGHMPQIVRSRIEDLLMKRALRFVCCTSTLLQGVNLPAKNIFIENPKKGRGKPMRPGDFWNLAGRAGRLAKEFHGNVWCIYGKPWDRDPLQGGRLEEMRSAFATAMSSEPERILDVIKAPRRPSEDDDYVYEQVFGRVFVDYQLAGRAMDDLRRDAPESKRAILAEIQAKCRHLAATITLPHDVFAKNATISPLKLEDLASFFRQQRTLLGWVPAIPRSRAGYKTMERIFGKLDDIFFLTGNRSFVYYCWLASEWMHGQSLKELIANKLKKNEVPDEPRKISNAIRELFDELENTLRYKYVKYLRAYNDVLRAVLDAGQEKNLVESIAPLHLLIEYGAFDETLINLMALGLSRTSATLLKWALRLPEAMSRIQCQARLNSIDVRQIALPSVCKDEITRIRRKSAHGIR